MPIGVFSKETAEQIYQWYQDTIGNDSRPDTLQYPDDWKQPWYLVKLTEDLAAADEPLRKFTQATANVLRYTDSDNLYRVEVTNTDFEITVTNRQSNVSLSSGAYVWVKKVGAEFVPFAGGGTEIGGFAIVRPFETCDGIGFSCDCANATVITASCNSGVNPGDIIQVWDLCRTWMNMAEELLYLSTFYAQKVKIHEDEYDRPPTLTGTCRWVVTGMCCIEGTYYGY